jgi:hypothetical protein
MCAHIAARTLVILRGHLTHFDSFTVRLAHPCAPRTVSPCGFFVLYGACSVEFVRSNEVGSVRYGLAGQRRYKPFIPVHQSPPLLLSLASSP